jgi:hypothetical protein
MLSRGGLGVGLNTRPEESYRVWCVSVIVKPRNTGDPGPLAVVAQWKKCIRLFLAIKCFWAVGERRRRSKIVDGL